MLNPLNISVLGFTPFEHSAISAVLRLAAKRLPPHQLVDDLTAADLVLVDADNRAVVRFFLKVRRQQKAILIGEHDHGTGLRVCHRPVRAVDIISAIAAELAPEPAAPIVQLVTSTATAATSDQTSAAGESSPAHPSADSEHREVAMTPHLSAVPSPEAAETQREMYATKDVPGAAAATTFVKAEAGAQPTASTLETEDLVSASSAPVLIVDDSPVAVLALQARLLRRGVACLVATSGEEALSTLGENNIRLVLLDVQMSGMDGYQTCRAIKRGLYGARQCPTVVMLTSRSGTVDKIRGTLAGCDGYQTKPLSDTALMDVLDKHNILSRTEWSRAMTSLAEPQNIDNATVFSAPDKIAKETNKWREFAA
jgi:two-component system, cell cycle response regulator